MRWFQLDSDTPNDPRIRAVIRQMGNEGFGALARLWCHIANHGEKRPGFSLNTAGRPMPVDELVEASGLDRAQFDQLVSICVETGHFQAREWTTRKVIAVPAMSRRADTYTKRRVRTRFEQPSKNVLPQDSTEHTNTRKNPPTPLAIAKGAVKPTRAERKRAEEIRKVRMGCHHEPTCASYEACLLTIVRDLRERAS